MVEYRARQDDMRFCYYDVFDGVELSQIERWQDATPELYDQILQAAAKLAEEVMDPIRLSAHEQGCRFENGEVTTPDGFKEAYKAYIEGGWPGLAAKEEFGGQGLPPSMGLAVKEMMISSNAAFSTYPNLSSGTVNVLTKWGTPELQKKFLPSMVAGNWTGTMCLTEAHCGSDLGMLRTRAEPLGDGTYAITGQKIFITGGQHDLSDNIVHMVLARLPDAPDGVKGISMFVVPRNRINDDDGTVGEHNNVNCGAIEHKMGQTGSATCVLNFDGAVGEMIGQPHRGLQTMFTMMNGARVGTGLSGLAGAEGAYQGALAYAQERLQGRSVRGVANPDGPADPIIVHPDVRRMLLHMKSITEASRALVTWIGQQIDFAGAHPDAEKRAECQALVDLLTPVVKAFITDTGFEATTLAQQVFGGHGYIREHGIEQFVRDTRIYQIWEGANGIQGMDLLGRKVPMDDGTAINALLAKIDGMAEIAKCHAETQDFAEPLERATDLMRAALVSLNPRIQKDPAEVGSASNDFLQLTGYSVFAYLWVRMAVASLSCEDKAFAKAKLHTARFYLTRLFPRAEAHAIAIEAGAATVMDTDVDLF